MVLCCCSQGSPCFSSAGTCVAVAALPDDHFGGNRRSLERVPPKPPNSRAHGCQHHHLCPPRLWQTCLRAVVRASIWLSFRCEPVQSGPPAHLFEVDRLAGSHKRLFARLLQMFGVVVSHAKRQRMTVMPRFLGMVTDFSQVHTSGHITLHGCPDTVERAKAMLEGFLQTRKVTSGQAAKARGVLNWLEMSLLGRPLTAAFAGLIARQFYESTDSLTPALQGCIECLLLALNTVPARSVPLFPRHEAPLLIYTDASTEAPNDTGCRIGFWIMDRGLVHVSSVDVPTSALSQWLARKTYINLLELLAAPILATCAPQLRGRDVL